MDWNEAFDQFVGPPLTILGIVVGAVVVRWLLHRAIGRVVASASHRHAERTVLLPGRAGSLLASASGIAHERYVQRTQTLGAVLRSVVTIAVSSIALLTIMAVLQIPLGPLRGAVVSPQR